MADVTGTVRVTHEGAEYTLRLTMGGLATLQAEFGRDLGGLLNQKKVEAIEEGGEDEIPDFKTLLRIVEVALAKGMPALEPARVTDIADNLLTADQGILGRLLESAFPDAAASSGNVKRPKAAA